VRLVEVFRTATFRTAALVAGAFGGATLLLFLFVYWQTAQLETDRIDEFLMHESTAILRARPDMVARDVATRYARDLHRQTLAALFTPARARIAGDIATYPNGLPVDGVPRAVTASRDSADGPVGDAVRAVARPLPDGRVLLVGRSTEQVTRLRRVVLRAMALGLLPALFAALGIGALASWRTLARLRRLNDTIARIMQGHLNERLEHAASGDAFDHLARGVNRMLDEIERLVGEVQGVGDDIAHELRTPLTRVRARLEGARARAASPDELNDAVDRSIADLDQCFSTVTALLRIGQIEGSARQAGFASVSLTAIAREAFELYQPVAELRQSSLGRSSAPDVTGPGDRDLLFEVAANLLDNAVKFTPPGGHVGMTITHTDHGPVLAVRDTGPGIAPDQRVAVQKRFHRGDRSRNVPGHGLGLSLVAAILRLHRFHLHRADAGPGLLVEVRTWPATG
jgi:signal transduction histidine kinase